MKSIAKVVCVVGLGGFYAIIFALGLLTYGLHEAAKRVADETFDTLRAVQRW